MDTKLLAQALIKAASGFIAMALLLFGPAGTIHWWQAWLLLGVLFIPMVIAGIVMLLKAPDLLRKRLNTNEQESQQKLAVILSAVMFCASFVAAAQGFRYGWPTFPDWLCWIGAAIFLASYLLIAQVMRENAFLSRTVEVQEGQKVIDTGMYGIVRHPMYAALFPLFLAMPITLGSPLGTAIMLIYIPIINIRIKNEEAVLTRELEGYAEYRQRIKWRLIPHIC